MENSLRFPAYSNSCIYMTFLIFRECYIGSVSKLYTSLEDAFLHGGTEAEMLSFLWSGSIIGKWGASECRTWEAAPAKRYLWLWACHHFTPLFCLHVWTLLFHRTARDKIHENLWIGQIGLQRHLNMLELRSVLVMSMLPAMSSDGQALWIKRLQKANR